MEPLIRTNLHQSIDKNLYEAAVVIVMLNIGIIGNKNIKVTKDNTAAALGSGSLEVFATPAMITLIEATASNSVQDDL